MRGGPSNPCLMCGQLDADDLHTYWNCPSMEASEEEDVKDTQYLVQAAKKGSVEYPCLWLRGCLPLVMVKITTPVVENEHFRYLSQPKRTYWPGGKLWTEASGGEFGKARRIDAVVALPACS